MLALARTLKGPRNDCSGIWCYSMMSYTGHSSQILRGVLTVLNNLHSSSCHSLSLHILIHFQGSDGIGHALAFYQRNRTCSQTWGTVCNSPGSSHGSGTVPLSFYSVIPVGPLGLVRSNYFR